MKTEIHTARYSPARYCSRISTERLFYLAKILIFNNKLLLLLLFYDLNHKHHQLNLIPVDSPMMLQRT